MQARYEYDPYGRRTKVSGTMEAAFGYTGHFWHEPSGLWLTWFRAYDPETGRWISRDPIEEGDGLNLYAYVGNDPIIQKDLFGLAKISKGVTSALNAMNAGRLYAQGMIKVAVGSGVALTGVGAKAGAATIGWGLWNLKGADAAMNRSLKQLHESPCEEDGWDNRNLMGLLPFGDKFEDE